MKLYHASLNIKVLLSYHQLFPNKKLNVLRSFGNLDHEMKDICTTHRGKINSLIFDSGTWTLNNAKFDLSKKITFQNYKNYVTDFGHYYDFYFNFDSDFIGDKNETNYQNQVALEEAGLEPVPVVHDIEGGEINYYIEKGYPIVALGSSQIKSVRTLEVVVDNFKGAGIKIHLFGKCKFEFLANFPISSCDSTAWSHRGEYGFIYYWNPRKEGPDKTDKIYMEEYLDATKTREVTYSNYEYRKELDEYLYQTLGVTEMDLLGPDGAFYKQLVNLHYYVKLEEIVNRIHRAKGF